MLRTLSLSLDPYCIAISGPFDKEHGFFLASSGIGTRIFSVIRWSSEFTSERTSQTGSSMVPGITSTQNLGNVNSTIPVPWCDFTWCDSMCQVRLPDRLVFSRHLEVGKGWGFINRWTVHGALSGGHKKLRISTGVGRFWVQLIWQGQSSFSWQGQTFCYFGWILFCCQCDLFHT